MNEAIQNGAPALEVCALSKSFTLHLQGRVHLAVLDGVDLAVRSGECVVLDGPSGAGKSTLMRTLYGNYRAEGGRILVRHAGDIVDLAAASPRLMLAVRRRTLGYVSQFLHVIPRVPTLAIVAEPLRALGIAAGEARDRAAALLERLALPERLWSLPPATFSGGEQQRVNIARGLAGRHPILLIDEPTASLDAENGARVSALLREALAEGVAMVGIFHDAATRAALATRLFRLPLKEPAA
jgi:alpha-D-ribose 1-methylphosphonate 5-triphosphate synthase subunit PhnL